MPANPGPAVRIPRYIFALAGQQLHKHKERNPKRAAKRARPDKKANVGVILALNAAECIQRPGVDRSRIERRNQKQIAEFVGWSASSFSRNLKRASRVKGQRVNYSACNDYDLLVPEGSKKWPDSKKWAAPSAMDLMANKVPVEEYIARRGKGAGGYGWGSGWLFHAQSRIPKNSVAVMAHLNAQFNFLGKRNGKLVDALDNVYQGWIARATSMTEDTVRRALWWWGKNYVCPHCGRWHYAHQKKKDPGARKLVSAWTWLDEKSVQCTRCSKPFEAERNATQEMLRMIQQPAVKKIHPDGSVKWEHPPCKLIWVADKRFTNERAAQELMRFKRALECVRERFWRELALNVFEQVAKSYVGTERHLATMYKEVRAKLLEAGIPEQIVHQIASRMLE